MVFRTLHELIAIDTQNPGADYTRIQDYLRTALKSRGARVQIVAGNVLGTWGDKPKLMFNAHMDTVRASGWTSDPLKARVQSERTYGLGACDTKGSIAAILEAVASAHVHRGKKNIDGLANSAVLFSMDEECGSPTGAASFFKTALGKSLARNLKAAVVMEPTQNRVIVRHPGYVQLDLQFKAPSGHSSSHRPSAASQAIDALYAIKRHAAWNVNVAGLSAATVGANIRSPSCLTNISIRSFQSPQRVIAAVKSHLPPNATLSVKQAEGPLDNKKPFVPSRLNVPYWTDGATFAAAGVNAVVYGPGSIGQAHQPDEFVTHASLQKAVLFLEKKMKTVGAFES
ncbi:M20/M25/M40 family metallo-hydrolase [Candidatus Micrarchaeota archaeon]|nr:M20/M25/M40 family metallo-hydrolase [Candidatus Micrarchaeota archaeon]